MHDQRDPVRTPQESAKGSPGKRPYVAPALTEYGSIGKLTLGSSGAKAEGIGMKRR